MIYLYISLVDRYNTLYGAAECGYRETPRIPELDSISICQKNCLTSIEMNCDLYSFRPLVSTKDSTVKYKDK